ncbi:MAG: class I SAM-dependent methyltransferase [Nitrospira sp.]|nr:class I SAM-dependent methyltransferase [Nitrospira sp.]
MENKIIQDSNSSYYNMVKIEFLPLITEKPNSILDVGCGTGQFGRKLREMNKASELVGIELYAPAAVQAEKYYDKMYHDDVESLDLPYSEYFDYVICGDILEHLSDPWNTVSRIAKMLKKDGALICSIPNIRYWKIIADLTLYGRWDYTDSGILDSTHLRFFTKSTFFEMLHKANYKVEWEAMVVHGRKKVVDLITFGMFSEFLTTQIMVMAKKG